MKTITVVSKKHGTYDILVDDEDYTLASSFQWSIVKNKYTFYATNCRSGRVPHTIILHRLLMPGAALVDHKDGNGLNNQKSNLRAATHSTNNANTKNRKNPIGYKGVYVSEKKYIAKISKDRKTTYLGTFDTALEAAKAYNEAAIKLFGEFASLNKT